MYEKNIKKINELNSYQIEWQFSDSVFSSFSNRYVLYMKILYNHIFNKISVCLLRHMLQE